jgi:2-C-methyl-D-erythritol 4-phosphate cytidylyltransferase/2-C-methyl-D-erythritol 2,4-cyclodiphosphate synthase
MTHATDTAVVLVAAGRGSRMGGAPKQWRDLDGVRVAARALAAFRDAGLSRIVVVVHPDDRAEGMALGIPVIIGGQTRSASVRAALDHLSATPPARVLIHDAARPLVTRRVIADVCAALDHAPAAAPGLPVVDALWRAQATRVTAPHPRDGLFRAQTPQGFHFTAILAAHRDGREAADDVELALSAGLEVTLVAGDEDNLKLTYPADFTRAEQILRQRNGQTAESQTMDIRTGNGYDVHRFGPGDQVWLCGVSVPHTRTLQGHSDADVGMHALTDAIYGALCEGDIGQHFPPSDPRWKGAASHIFLRHAMERVAARGYRLTHCDVTLVCEYPKIGPHAPAMRAALALIMGVHADQVSVKATTSERLGFTGREEGIAALATATLVKP